MTKLKPYTKYKDSGIPWIGRIPVEWQVKKIRHVISTTQGGVWGDEAKQDDKSYICYRVADFNFQNGTLSDKKNTKRKIDKKSNEIRQLQSGDILVEKSGGGKKTSVGRTVIFDDSNEAFCSNFIQLIRPNGDINSKYLTYMTHAYYFSGTIIKDIKQTTGIQNLDIKSYVDNYIACPDSKTQNKIVYYLEHKQKEIDKYIKRLKKEIALLKEHRQKIIHQSITSGINEDNAIRNHSIISSSEWQKTDISWAEYIPKHWEVKKLKFVFRVRKKIAGELGYSVLAITQKGIKVKDIKSNLGQLSSDYSKYQLVRKGDFAMNHMDLLTGYVDISEYDGVTSPDYRVFEMTDKQCNPKYMLYILQTCYHERLFYSLGRGAARIGRWRLGIDAFNNFLLPIPSLKEQSRIVKFLDSKLIEIDKQIDEINNQIQLIKEYKQSLISKVVTGKIDVRNINNNLSEE